MVVNTEGKIAIKWAIQQRMPKAVRIDETGEYFVFTSRQNVSMDWVNPEYVAKILSIKETAGCKCNKGNLQPAYTYASLIDVNLWTYNDRHTPEGAPYKEEQ